MNRPVRIAFCALSMVSISACNHPQSISDVPSGTDPTDPSVPRAQLWNAASGLRPLKRHRYPDMTVGPADAGTSPSDGGIVPVTNADMALSYHPDLAMSSPDLAIMSSPDLAIMSSPDLAMSRPAVDMAASGNMMVLPAVTSVDPPSGPAGSYLTVSGANFQGGDVVQLSSSAFGTVSATTVSLTAGAIVARLPSGLAPSAALVRVMRGGSTVPAAGLAFTVLAGHVYYLSPGGSDGNAGTLAAPWLRLDNSAAKMHPGDVAYLRGGTYTGSSTIRQSGAAGANLVFTAYPGESPLLDNPANSTEGAVPLVIESSYVTIDHLRVTNHYAHGNGVEVTVQSQYVLFSNNEVFNILGNGVITTGTNGLFVGNTVHDVAVDGEHNHCFYIQGSYNTFRHNHVYNAKYYGFHLYSGLPTPGGHNIIENNLVHDCGYGTVADNYSHVTAGIILAWEQPGTIVRNNVFCHNANYGLYVNGAEANNQIYGNVSCYNPSGGFYMEGAGPNLQFTHNISYNDHAPAMMGMPGVTGDYNTYYTPAGAPDLQWQYQDYTLQGYQAAFGQELHSQIADPHFQNVPTTGFDPAAATTYNFCTSLNSALCN